ncbi:MAG TPA: hypothetical protein VGM39_07560 [Kofleriaceae bacterium]|jgi:hypothetical protein
MRWVLLLGLAACGRISFEPLAADGGSAGDADDAASDAPAGSIQYVQSASGLAGTGSMSVTAQLPSKPTPGNLIVVAGTGFQFQGLASLADGSVVDSGSGPIPLVVHEVTPDNCASRGTSVALYAVVATAQSSGMITVTQLPITMDETTIFVAEYSGVTTLDDSTSFSTASGPSPHAIRSGATNAATGSELAVAAGTDCSGDPDPQVYTDTAGFDVGYVEDILQMNVPGIFTRKIVTTPGPVEDTWTVEYTGPAADAFAVIATFR